MRSNTLARYIFEGDHTSFSECTGWMLFVSRNRLHQNEMDQGTPYWGQWEVLLNSDDGRYGGRNGGPGNSSILWSGPEKIIPRTAWSYKDLGLMFSLAMVRVFFFFLTSTKNVVLCFDSKV